MKEERPKCFTEEELNQFSELAKSGVKYTLTENDFNEIKESLKSKDD